MRGERRTLVRRLLSMSVSLDEIRMMFKAENASMLDGALQVMERQMAARLADQEARFMRVVSALQNRMEQLELRDRDRNDGNDEPAVQEVKRPRRNLNAENGNVGMGSNARDLPASRRHDEVERHTVVFSGFTAKSRKRLLIDYVKLQLPVVERLAGHTDVSDLGDKVFTPSIRTNIVMIRLPNKTAMFRFLNAWKQADEDGQISRFGDEELVIRAKRDKPPALRRAHGKLWQLFTHLKNLGHSDTEIDWKNCSLWIKDYEVVKWDQKCDSVIWREEEISKLGLQIDIDAANLTMSNIRSS